MCLLNQFQVKIHWIDLFSKWKKYNYLIQIDD